MYTAVIVEMRKHKALSFVINNALECLSDEWKVLIVHGQQNDSYVRYVVHTLSQYHDRIMLVRIDMDNLTREEYNKLWINCVTLYERIPTEIFLVFQTDSMIFKRNAHLIKEFLEYDYVGAPWSHPPIYSEWVGNGGLSLRRKSKMLEIIRNGTDKDLAEDVFFSCNRAVSVYKPNMMKARRFSMEQVYSDESFGCHQPWVMEDTYMKILITYPEVQQLKDLQGVI
jgi:hypothetical protein